jgi:hypothetical protein
VRLTVRHITREEAEGMSGGVCAGMRWLIVDADHPKNVNHQDSMLGIPSGADYLIGAIGMARTIARARGHRLVLSTEMKHYVAAKDALEAVVKPLKEELYRQRNRERQREHVRLSRERSRARALNRIES